MFTLIITLIKIIDNLFFRHYLPFLLNFYYEFKDGLSLKIKNLDIHLYSIATKYLWNNALVEYIDNWTQSYSLVIIYRNRQKYYLTG